MKKIFFLLFAVLGLCAVAACSDNLSDVGATVRPEEDGMVIRNKNYDLNIQTVYRDSVYVRTGYPLLGTITDPEFGEISASYLAQFYANKETGLDVRDSYDSVTFDILRTSAPASLGYDWADFHYRSWDSICNNQIDSMTIRIYYQSFYGDSLTPMQVSIYSLNPDVDFSNLPESEFYSNNDFSELYTADKEHLLGTKAYTVANREVSDSVRNDENYMNYLEVKLDDMYKEEFFKMCVEAAIARDKSNPHHKDFTDIFADESKLRKSWLSGVCVKPTFGDGAVVKVYYTAIYFYYSSHHRYNPDGTLLRNERDDADSTYNVDHVAYFAVTPDVIQMSGIRFSDENKEDRLKDQKGTYISSPQGYYTSIDLPLGQIMHDIYNDPLRKDSSYFVNAANFYLKAYKPEGHLLSKTPVPTVLMVRSDSINTFFEKGMLPSSSTSCYAVYACDSVPKDSYIDPTEGIYYYNFGNISSVVTGLAEASGWDRSQPNSLKEWERVLRAKGELTMNQGIEDYCVKMAVIPVDVTTNPTYGTLLSVSNYILPTTTRLKKNSQRLQLIYTLDGTSEE
ncbi:MAG: DUF4270 family protein [Bacteroidales bacterium]|nr:DUF4270 family protein [Bacteroidales bacterium]